MPAVAVSTAPLGRQGDVADVAVRQSLRRPTVEADGVGDAAAAALLAAVRRGEHPTVGGPAEDHRGGDAEVREPPPVAAVEVDDVDLRGAVDRARPGHPLPVRRQPRSTHRDVVGADPPRLATGERCEPDVVLGDEREQIAGQVGEAQVAASHRRKLPARCHAGPVGTHEVVNQATPLVGHDVAAADVALMDGVARSAATGASPTWSSWGRRAGDPEVIRWAELANEHEPELHRYDRFGHRIDTSSTTPPTTP